MRNRAFRRHQVARHMWRRLKEDRNQHYNDLDCDCWHDRKAMAKFKEQPKLCACAMCCNRRAVFGLTLQERKFFAGPAD
jgi:hypothetical protein